VNQPADHDTGAEDDGQDQRGASSV